MCDDCQNVHGDTMGMKNVVGRFYDKYVTEPSLYIPPPPVPLSALFNSVGGSLGFFETLNVARQRYTLTKNGLIKKVREIAVREKRADDTKVPYNSKKKELLW
jgi:hypothetical protein